jgi:hypothetical protein
MSVPGTDLLISTSWLLFRARSIDRPLYLELYYVLDTVNLLAEHIGTPTSSAALAKPDKYLAAKRRSNIFVPAVQPRTASNMADGWMTKRLAGLCCSTITVSVRENGTKGG